jgi:hypothetical protein
MVEAVSRGPCNQTFYGPGVEGIGFSVTYRRVKGNPRANELDLIRL